MKKFASLLMAVLMMCTILTAMAIPAFAGGSPTVVKPVDGDIILRDNSGDFIINEDCTVIHFNVGENVTLTIAPNVTVTVTYHLGNKGTLNVFGNLIVTECYMTNWGTINVGCVGTIEGTIPGTVNKGVHHYVNSVCENCNTPCPHANTKTETVTTITTTKTCKDCEKVLDKHTTTTSTHTSSASTLSEGSLTIICSVACLAVGLVGGLVIGKKKKVKSEA